MFSGGGDAGVKCKMQISFIVVMHLAIQALSLASLQACHRETKEANIPNKRNIVKSPNWQGSRPVLLSAKRDRGFELGTTEKQIPLVAGGGKDK